MAMDSAGSTQARLKGRRPGASTTRESILLAARTRFAKDGYSGATIRKIAADAGVDASLVMQFFRSKEELFSAVMSASPSALSRIADAFAGPPASLGERVTRAFLEVWDGDPHESEPLLAMLRASIGSEQATAQLRQLIHERIIGDLLPQLGDNADMASRVEIVTAMLVGVAIGRHLVHVNSLTLATRDSLVAYIAPGIQAILAPQF
jgi:AcrR family transcriptional regulator